MKLGLKLKEEVVRTIKDFDKGTVFLAWHIDHPKEKVIYAITQNSLNPVINLQTFTSHSYAAFDHHKFHEFKSDEVCIVIESPYTDPHEYYYNMKTFNITDIK